MTSFRPSSTSSYRLFPVLLILLGLTLAQTSRAQAQDDDDDGEVVRVNTELVILNVTVVDGAGKYVHGLRSTDFMLFEDGQPQSISSFGSEETPFAAAVLLDTSASMERRVTLARSAAIRFLDGLRTDDVAAVYHFNSKIEQVQEFSFSHDLADMAFGLRAKGLTVLNDAILRASEDLSHRAEKRRAIVVLSDGGDTRSKASMDKALATALAANATIFTVDMSAPDSTPADRLKGASALRALALKSGGRYFESPGGQALREAFASVVEELGNQYTIVYKPTNKARDGRWRTIELKLSRPDITARTRKGYKSSGK
jgi:Ca-activated chloride channel family protein